MKTHSQLIESGIGAGTLLNRTPLGRALTILAASSLCVALIWLPFGFAQIGHIEEWDILGLFNMYGPFSFASSSSPLPAHALRPLTPLPNAIGYILDPDSFFYWHVLLIGILVAKGSAAAHILFKCTRSLRWAAITAMLVLLYPADTMQLSFRSIHINWALAMTLVATSCYLEATESVTRAASYAWSTLAAACILFATSMYEASLALTVLPLIALFAKEGFRGAWRTTLSRLWIPLIWAAGVGTYIVYAIITSRQITSYQESILGNRSFIGALFSSLPNLATICAPRALLDGWIDAARMIAREFATRTYLLLATVVLFAFVAWLPLTRSRMSNADPAHRNAPPGEGRLLIAGLAAMFLGYLPFLFSQAHLAISQRTYLFATPGAAMAWVAILMLLAGRPRPRRWLAMPLVGIMLCLGVGAQWTQFHHYVNLSQTERTLMKAVMESFDGDNRGKQLVVLDSSDQLGQVWMFTPPTLGLAMTYFYGHPVPAPQVCHMPAGEWQTADSLGRKGRCSYDGVSWTFTPPDPVTGPGYVPGPPIKGLQFPASDVALIRIGADEQPMLPAATLSARRAALATGQDAASRRYRGVLVADHRLIPMFKDQFPRDWYQGDFGRWWSLEVAVRGSGWRNVGWESGPLHHQSSAWKGEGPASLDFSITPNPNAYVLRGRFDNFAGDLSRQSLQLSINGQNLAFGWGKDGKFEAQVPPGVLVNGANKLIVEAVSRPDYYGLSAKLVKFELRPRSR